MNALELATCVAARTDELLLYAGDGSNDAAVVPWPSELPADRPYAVFVASNDRMYTIAFDFDPKKGDASQDSEALMGILDEIDIQAVHCASGPTGGHHVLFRVDNGIDLESVLELRDRARLKYPSLDPSALSNVSRQAIRPPLAPHRTSGRSDLVGDDEWSATMKLKFGNESFHVRQLIERLPELDEAEDVEPFSITSPAHPRRKLTKRVQNLVRHGDREGRFQSRSDMIQSIANSYYLAGLSFEQLAADLADPGNVGGARYRESGDVWLWKSWESAQIFTEENPLPNMNYLVEETARTMATEQWSGVAGVKERLILVAHLSIALNCYRQTYTASDRQLSEVSGLDRKTIAKGQLLLVSRGLLRRNTVGTETCASSWTIFPALDPHGTQEEDSPPLDQSLGGGEDYPPLDHLYPERGGCVLMGEGLPLDMTYFIEHLNHDAFSAKALGSSALIVLSACSETEPRTLVEIAARTQLTVKTVRGRILASEASQIVSEIPGGWVRLPTGNLDQVAIDSGTAGRIARKEARNRMERIQYARRGHMQGNLSEKLSALRT